MIIFPQSDEKTKDVFPSTTTQVYHASMPEPRLNEGDIDRLSQRFDTNLNIEEQPPAYDILVMNGTGGADNNAMRGGPAGDVKDPNTFQNNPAAGEQPTGDAPTPRSRDFDGIGGPGRGRRVPNFQPLVMHSRGKKLEDGFFQMLPPTDVRPHPFTQRDVKESDWTKFLSDLQTSARLSPNSSTQDGERGSFLKNVFRSFSGPAGKQPEQGSRGGPGALVDTWNENFFHRRGLDVVLAKGSHRLNGDRSLPPPDYSSSEGNRRPHSPRSMPAQSSMPSMPPMPPMPPMPSMPPMPRQTSMPSMPSMPPMPAMPAMPPMPPMPDSYAHNVQNGDHKARRSRSSSSLSSSSSSDSDSNFDSEHDHHRHHHHHGTPHSRGCGANSFSEGTGEFASRCEARAARRAHRLERRAHKWERHWERKQMRFARKLSLWEAKIGTRGMGPGMGPGFGPFGFGIGRGGACGSRGGFGRGGCHGGPMWSHHPRGPGPLGSGFALAQGIAAAFTKEDDGYYRLIVTDLV